jgi:ribosomal protein L16 Arg81 hydroxylase
MMQALQSSNLPDEANDGSESYSSCVQMEVEALRNLGSQLQECSLRPGEVLYFPEMWPHATLNTDAYNAFVSVFIDPQLMRD